MDEHEEEAFDERIEDAVHVEVMSEGLVSRIVASRPARPAVRRVAAR